jgi:hypothetical protein
LGALFPPNGRYALLVALTASPDLFICAKDLFVEANAAPRHQFRPPDEPNDEAGDDQCDQEDAREHDPACRLVIRFCGCQHNVTLGVPLRCLTRREGCPSTASPDGGRVRAPDGFYQQRPGPSQSRPWRAVLTPSGQSDLASHPGGLAVGALAAPTRSALAAALQPE